jgi:hypothetical protein
MEANAIELAELDGHYTMQLVAGDNVQGHHAIDATKTSLVARLYHGFPWLTRLNFSHIIDHTPETRDHYGTMTPNRCGWDSCVDTY